MRKRFKKQTELGLELIEEVDLSMRSRDQLPKLLAGLQYIFVTPSINSAVFELLENKICCKSKNTGRPGMDLWEILVLGVVRLNLNVDYDRLHYMANYDQKLRGILGVHPKSGDWSLGKEYKIQTIKDNVCLLDESTLKAINHLIVGAGHELKKKRTKRKEKLPFV